MAIATCSKCITVCVCVCVCGVCVRVRVRVRARVCVHTYGVCMIVHVHVHTCILWHCVQQMDTLCHFQDQESEHMNFLG